MTIRRVTGFDPRDLEAVRRLLLQLSAGCGPLTEERYRRLVGSPCSSLFFACDGDAVVGMLTLAVYDIPVGRRGWIEDLVVDADCRGRGAGRMLVDHALAVARRMGAADVMLTSNPARAEANALYRKMGFEPRQTNVYKKNCAE